MKKALLFGGNGYLGRHLAKYLKQHQIDFVVSGTNQNSIDGYSNYIQADITKLDDLKKIDFDVDYVFIFAGRTGTQNDDESKKQFIKVNEQGLKNILSCCKKHQPHVVFPSSRLVYKGQKNIFLKEESSKEAKTIYAQNKINCERILINFQKDYNINYTIFRICVPYGNVFDNKYSYGTLGFFLKKAMNNENITLFGSGEQKRTFTHVEDIINVIFEVLKFPLSINNWFNIGSNDALSLVEVAILVSQKFGVEVEHIDWPKQALKIESGDTIFNDDKLLKLTTYKYKHNLNDWLTTLNL